MTVKVTWWKLKQSLLNIYCGRTPQHSSGNLGIGSCIYHWISKIKTLFLQRSAQFHWPISFSDSPACYGKFISAYRFKLKQSQMHDEIVPTRISSTFTDLISNFEFTILALAPWSELSTPSKFVLSYVANLTSWRTKNTFVIHARKNIKITFHIVYIWITNSQ